MSMPSEKVLDELDQQEMHIRRLARRIDGLRVADESQELAVATRLHKALHGALQSIEDSPNELRQIAAVWLRSESQRECVAVLARAVAELGADIDLSGVETNLRRGYERMPSTLRRHLSDNPADLFLAPAGDHEAEHYDLAFDVVQDELLRVDLALDKLAS